MTSFIVEENKNDITCSVSTIAKTNQNQGFITLFDKRQFTISEITSYNWSK